MEHTEGDLAATFGTAAAELNPQDRFAYLGWLSKHLEEAGALNKASTRLTICLALAGMPNYEVKLDGPLAQVLSRHDQMPVGYMEMLEAIVPPNTDNTWGSYGRPKSLAHQTYRMTGNDKNGKSVNLITQHEGPEMPKGKYIEGVKLAPNGMCYAHIHGRGNVTKDDLVEYWRHETQGVEVAATNHAYLAMIGQEPPPDDSIYQYQSPGSEKWGVLAHLMGDPTVPERYRDANANELGKGLKAVMADDPAEALELLTKDDQRAVFTDILYHSGAGNPVVLVPFIDGLEKDTYKERVAKLMDIYETANTFSVCSIPRELSAQIIGELICRATWVVISRVMEYRVGMFETIQTSTDTALDLAQTQAQLLLLQRYVAE